MFFRLNRVLISFINIIIITFNIVIIIIVVITFNINVVIISSIVTVTVLVLDSFIVVIKGEGFKRGSVLKLRLVTWRTRV